MIHISLTSWKRCFLAQSLLLAGWLSLSSDAVAQTPTVPTSLKPVGSPTVAEVWPGKPPGEIGNIGEEKLWDKSPIPNVGGKPVKWLTNVSKPSLTIYRPSKDKDTGASMVICPGGGLTYLAWDSEGEEVAAWLNSIGVTGIILKYRVPRRPDQLDFAKFNLSTWLIRPLQDGQRAISLVRSKAAEWGLDPKRIGMIGFSAGAGLTAWTCTNFNHRAYDASDAIDQISCRPDFGVLLYPGGGAGPGKDKNRYQLDSNVPITRECPPMFFACARDDGDKPQIIACMHEALQKAGVAGALHVYASGGHDFALRLRDKPCGIWPQDCEAWLRQEHFLK